MKFSSIRRMPGNKTNLAVVDYSVGFISFVAFSDISCYFLQYLLFLYVLISHMCIFLTFKFCDLIT